ncbi:MAG TPA: hypothetical protein VIC84_11595 [Blastocatellia bacterium]|jgi:hypothetical protein
MDAELFWRLISDVCKLGEFIASTGTGGASANIVGKLQVGYDGSEMVIQRTGCDDHIHCQPDQIAWFKFGHCDIGYGAEPCLELINQENQVCLKFYYRGGEAGRKYRQFIERHRRYGKLFAGEW